MTEEHSNRTQFKITDVYDITGRGVATLDLDKALRSAPFRDRMKAIVEDIEKIAARINALEEESGYAAKQLSGCRL